MHQPTYVNPFFKSVRREVVELLRGREACGRGREVVEWSRGRGHAGEEIPQRRRLWGEEYRCHIATTCVIFGVTKTMNITAISIAMRGCSKTRLLRWLQAQTLTDATPPKGKIHPFSKIAVTLEPVMRFGYPWRFRIS